MKSYTFYSMFTQQQIPSSKGALCRTEALTQLIVISVFGSQAQETGNYDHGRGLVWLFGQIEPVLWKCDLNLVWLSALFVVT